MLSARFYEEREQLALRLDEVIRACLAADGVPAVNDAAEDVFGRYAIGTYPEQREMRFFLGNLAAFTPRLVNALRDLVANEFKKWSVVPQFDAHEFTITASAVVFRGRSVRRMVDEHTPAFVAWLAAARKFDTKRFGPMRNQLKYVRPRIPAALKAAGKNGVAVVGAFDFYVPYFWDGNPVVWLVLGRTLADGGVEVEAGSQLRTSAVTASGFVFPEYTSNFSEYTDEQPAGNLMTIEFAPADQNRMRLKTRAGKSIGRITIPQIMTRKELKRETA